MTSHVIVKTIRNFFCPKVNTDVHIEFLTDMKYQDGHISDTREVLAHPFCEQQDQCGIGRRHYGRVFYDWSLCANAELRQTGRRKEQGNGANNDSQAGSAEENCRQRPAEVSARR